jgi:hypothetical protein
MMTLEGAEESVLLKGTDLSVPQLPQDKTGFSP